MTGLRHCPYAQIDGPRRLGQYARGLVNLVGAQREVL